jgi:glycosyltransferase involved in cell wall biosynthesis
LKLACVIHRFGTDIAGGSEGHCRGVAERLAEHHDITILTTCARDHITWQNEYPAGSSKVGRLAVRRFPVARTRSLHQFTEISELVFSGAASETEQERWFRENGPEAPELLEFLERHGAEYDWILFWSFRYYQTFFGLPLVADRAVLVPTAEEDPLIRGAGILGRFFALPAGFVFLTPEEQTLVAARAPGPMTPSCVIGSGVEPVRHSSTALPAGLGIPTPFVLYLGRIDPNKGCETLLRHFMKHQATATRTVSLVLAGPANMPIPHHPSVRSLGFVDEAVREALLSNASLLIVPSRYESLSIVLLEAWNHGVPALVNGRCSVLKGQAIRANGALYYENFDEFARALDFLLDHPDLARQLGQQGLAYVDSQYRWPLVMERIERFLASLSRPGPRR